MDELSQLIEELEEIRANYNVGFFGQVDVRNHAIRAINKYNEAILT